MIIFDLDGTLANCEHRRHFVDPLSLRPGADPYELSLYSPDLNAEYYYRYANGKKGFFYHKTHKRWVPNWKSFYEACDKDEPIYPVHSIMRSLWAIHDYNVIEIWSGRCESVRDKTEAWLMKYGLLKGRLKMRPQGDSIPDDELKECWLEEKIASGIDIQFVFDDRPKVVRMWRRRGIFVFDVNQSGKEF